MSSGPAGPTGAPAPGPVGEGPGGGSGSAPWGSPGQSIWDNLLLSSTSIVNGHQPSAYISYISSVSVIISVGRCFAAQTDNAFQLNTSSHLSLNRQTRVKNLISDQCKIFLSCQVTTSNTHNIFIILEMGANIFNIFNFTNFIPKFMSLCL